MPLPTPTKTEWMNLIGPVNKAGAEIELLVSKYGPDAMSVAISIFYDNLPEALVYRVEQYRYINSQLQGESIKSLSRHHKDPILKNKLVKP